MVHPRPHKRPGQRAGRRGEDMRSGVRKTRSKPSPKPPAQGLACGCALGPLGSRPTPIPAGVLPLYCRPLTLPVERVLRFRGSSQGANPSLGRALGASRLWPLKQPHGGQTLGPRLKIPGPHRPQEGCPCTGCSEHPHSPAPEPPRHPERHPLPTGAWLARLGLTH